MSKNSIKILVDGKAGVGRSTMCLKYTHKNEEDFDSELDSCLENSWKKIQKFEGKEYTLEITDSEDCEDKLTESYYQNADCLIFVYSITDKESLEILKHKYDYHQKLTGNKSVPIILIGNKLDQEDSRQVSKEDAEKFCQHFHKSKVFEISVLKNEQEKVFQEAIHMYISK